MHSNYNVLTLPMRCDGKYKVGDIFMLSDDSKQTCSWRILKFDGLQIKNIDYCFGVRLHFDWKEWSDNNPLYNTESKQKQTTNPRHRLWQKV